MACIEIIAKQERLPSDGVDRDSGGPDTGLEPGKTYCLEPGIPIHPHCSDPPRLTVYNNAFNLHIKGKQYYIVLYCIVLNLMLKGA